MVLSTLFTILRTGAIVLLLNDYFKRVYPAKYDNLLIEIPLQIIYLYSKCQIIYAKVHRQINEFIDANPHIKTFIDDFYKSKSKSNDDDLEIEYIVNGVIYTKYKRTQSLPDRTENDGSLLIFSDLSASDNNNKCVHKKILQNEINFDYKVAAVQFMLMELSIDDKTFIINLKTDTYNYYIVDNVIDRKFISYYLMKNYTVITYEDIRCLTKYSLRIIDQNVNVKDIEITDTKFITIKENEYTVSE